MGYETYNQLQMRETVVNVVALQCREYHHYGEVLYLLGWHYVIVIEMLDLKGLLSITYSVPFIFQMMELSSRSELSVEGMGERTYSNFP